MFQSTIEQPKRQTNSIALAKEIVNRIGNNDCDGAKELIAQLADNSNEFPRQWLLSEIKALDTDNFNLISEGFENLNFVGDSGFFLLIAPYTLRREGEISTKITAILGQISNFNEPKIKKMKQALIREFGQLHQEVPIILPYQLINASGNAGGEKNEAFMVANNWQIKNSARGPVLNNMGEQHRRFRSAGLECMKRIWSPSTAEFLTSIMLDETTANYYRSLEYQLHEFGHAAGLGIETKINAGVFASDYWNASVEEARSDGIELELATRELSEQEAAKIVMVNFSVRQALDCHRRGGLNRDGDVGASLINFSMLWESGEIGIKNSQLYLRNLNHKGLLRAVSPHREWAMRLTRKELNLDYPQGIFRLYGSVSVHPAIEEIFQGMVIDPCKGIFKELR